MLNRRTLSPHLSEFLELRESFKKLNIDRLGWVGQYDFPPLTNFEMRPLCELDKVSLAQLALSPVHPVSESGLLSRGQQL